MRAADPQHPSKLASTDQDGWNGTFIVPINGTLWFVQLSDKHGWRHLYACSSQDHALVKADTLLALRGAFYADDAYVVQFVGAPFFIGDDRGHIHLWESIETPMTVPLADERPRPAAAD